MEPSTLITQAMLQYGPAGLFGLALAWLLRHHLESLRETRAEYSALLRETLTELGQMRALMERVLRVGSDRRSGGGE